MAYDAKTDWQYDDTPTEQDLNRIEQGIADAHAEIAEFDIPDATLTSKGKVQLSSAIDSTAEDQAATPKAVKEVQDRSLPKDGSEVMTGPITLAPQASVSNSWSMPVRMHYVDPTGEVKYADLTTSPTTGELYSSTSLGQGKFWTAANDGEGSGLDADTVDGVHVSDLKGRNGQQISTDLNLHTLSVGHYYVDGSISTAQNYPYNAGWEHFTIDVLGTELNGYGSGDTNNYRIIVMYNQVGECWIKAKHWNVWEPWRKMWDSTNDGAGSGLDADTVRGKVPLPKDGSEVMTGRLVTAATMTPMATAPDGAANLEVSGGGTGHGAFMAFHRPGSYACYFGLDADNQLKVGGWSAGSIAYKVWNAGNHGAGSGLDADLLDGKQASQFQNHIVTGHSGEVINRPYGTDFNSIVLTGFYDVQSTVNSPTSWQQWWFLEVFRHYNLNVSYLLQRATAITDGEILTYERRCMNGSWEGWTKLLNQTDYNTLFQYANDGKTAVANAVTAKGVSASPAETFATLASKIGQIQTGFVGARGTVAANSRIHVTGLSFTPNYVIVLMPSTGRIWFRFVNYGFTIYMPGTSVYSPQNLSSSNAYHITIVANSFGMGETGMYDSTIEWIAIQ
ncbi:MAG: putative phage tail protein [Paenibacillaceae bacterium]|jgi:hypothetical protein|nr:putative phage tail protein [Paenibacillaceae bacterium]